jgi:hypothetical protein
MMEHLLKMNSFISKVVGTEICLRTTIRLMRKKCFASDIELKTASRMLPKGKGLYVGTEIKNAN